jgi:phosphate acetyltransferase
MDRSGRTTDGDWGIGVLSVVKEASLVGLSRRDAAPGMSASIEHVLRERGFDVVAALFGVPDAGAGKPPGAALTLLVQGIILDFVARGLPGPGCEVLAQEVRYVMDPAVGDRVVVSGTLASRSGEDLANIVLTVDCDRGKLAEGSLLLRLPAEPVTLQPESRPDIILHRHRHLERLMSAATRAPALSVAVAWPCDRDSLMGPLQALRDGGIRPILVGPRDEIASAAAALGMALDGAELLDAATPAQAAMLAVQLCREGRAQALMKGSLHTDELMGAVVSREGGLRTRRRISHVFAMDVPSYPKALFVTDAAINIAPDLMTKADIIQNAVDMLHALGNPRPKAAILSAVETVNPKIPGTLDAALLCKMADRGQITGAVLDGPLAFDNAISRAAAEIKKIASPVAGEADILVVPDLEAGNMLAKQLSYLAGADSAGIVLGAKVPIILTSRADSVSSRLASIALARLLAAASGTPT